VGNGTGTNKNAVEATENSSGIAENLEQALKSHEAGLHSFHNWDGFGMKNRMLGGLYCILPFDSVENSSLRREECPNNQIKIWRLIHSVYLQFDPKRVCKENSVQDPMRFDSFQLADINTRWCLLQQIWNGN